MIGKIGKIFCFGGGVFFAKYLMSLIYQKETDLQSTSEENINCILFFPDQALPCPKVLKRLPNNDTDKICSNISCRGLHNRKDDKLKSNFLTILKLISGARKQVDVCIYLFTQYDLAELLIKLHQSNLATIRVITDSTEHHALKSKIGIIKESGIAVKSNKHGDGSLMHNKFIIIDNSILLCGSFNWTAKAVASNYETVLVTQHETIVSQAVAQFSKLWYQFPDY